MEYSHEGHQRSHSQDDHDEDDFSMSSYEGEHTDSLVIKPPQAVIQRREKREKRDKKEKHRHKERHKSRHRIREEKPGASDEKRRERRRHREHEVEGSRHEARRHEKHRDRSKRERYPAEHRTKERKMERDQMERHRDRHRMRDEYIQPDHSRYDHRHDQMSGHSIRGHMNYHHRERMHNDDRLMISHNDNLIDLENLSPKEKSEREKRMERFMVADKQKEMSQRDADVRRQRREEEKRIDELRQRAEASMLRHKRNLTPTFDQRQKRDTSEPEMVELISDDDVLSLKDISSEPDGPELSHPHEKKEGSEKKRKKKHKKDERPEEIRNSSVSANESSDSDTSTTSSEEEDDEEEQSDGNDKHGIEMKGQDEVLKPASPSHSQSGSSTDTSSDDDKDERDSDTHSEADYPKDSPLQSPTEVKEELPNYYPAIMGCRSVDEFECLNRIEEGTYGVVYRAREKSTNEIVALKRLKMEKEKEGFPITSLREVNTLLKGQHINIVTVREIVVGSNMDKIYIVMDYVEHDLKALMETMRQKKQSFTIGEVKTLMIQLLRAVHHLHDNWILHRDLKTSNLLLSHRGILKVGDFGLAREYGSPLKQYTPIVVTLWYRAPELLLGTKQYSCPIDVWSIGCIYGELLGMEPMFPGKSEIDQLNKIFKDLGTPSDKIWPGYSQMPVIRKTQFAEYPYNHLRERFKTRLSNEGFDIFNKFLTYDPSKRITCLEALSHHYFTFEPPAPIDPAMFPTWPAKSENPYGRAKKAASPKPPSGGKNFKDLGEDENIAGFFLGGAPNSGPGFTLKF